MNEPIWTMRCYVHTDGRDEIDAWFDSRLDESWRDKARAKFDSIMRFLRAQPHTFWNKND